MNNKATVWFDAVGKDWRWQLVAGGVRADCPVSYTRRSTALRGVHRYLNNLGARGLIIEVQEKDGELAWLETTNGY